MEEDVKKEIERKLKYGKINYSSWKKERKKERKKKETKSKKLLFSKL